jgi:hypothetical protein
MDPYILRDTYAAELISRCAAVYVAACWLLLLIALAGGCISALLAYTASRSVRRERERVEARIARSINWALQARPQEPPPPEPEFVPAGPAELRGAAAD